LNWAISGYQSLQEMGRFIEPKTSTEAHSEYRRQLDPTIDFTSERLRTLPPEHNGTALQDIYEAYRPWMKSNGYDPLGRNNSYKALSRITKRKIVKNDDTGARHLQGIFLL